MINNNSNNEFQITFAKKGIFEFKGDKKILVLYDGKTITQKGKNITNFDFSKSDFGLANMESHLTTHKKIQEQSTISLIKCMQFLFGIKEYIIVNCYKNQPRGAYKELIRRLISPFYLPVLILTSLLLILTSKENLKYNTNKYSVFFIGFGLIILSESLLGYVTDNFINNTLIIILPIFLISILYFIFVYKLKSFNKKL